MDRLKEGAFRCAPEKLVDPDLGRLFIDFKNLCYVENGC